MTCDCKKASNCQGFWLEPSLEDVQAGKAKIPKVLVSCEYKLNDVEKEEKERNVMLSKENSSNKVVKSSDSTIKDMVFSTSKFVNELD
jgi:hypothetical protein